MSLTKNSVRDPLNYGFILINNGAIGELPLNSLVVTLTDGTDVETVEAAVSAYYPDALMLDSRTQNSVHGIASDAGMYRSLSYVFPLLAYAVAAMIVLTTITRMLENQRTQMGCLKALGYRDGQIQRHHGCSGLYETGRCGTHIPFCLDTFPRYDAESLPRNVRNAYRYCLGLCL